MKYCNLRLFVMRNILSGFFSCGLIDYLRLELQVLKPYPEHLKKKIKGAPRSNPFENILEQKMQCKILCIVLYAQ